MANFPGGNITGAISQGGNCARSRAIAMNIAAMDVAKVDIVKVDVAKALSLHGWSRIKSAIQGQHLGRGWFSMGLQVVRVVNAVLAPCSARLSSAAGGRREDGRCPPGSVFRLPVRRAWGPGNWSPASVAWLAALTAEELCCRAEIAKHPGLNALASINRHGRPGPELVLQSRWPGDRQSRSEMLDVNW